MAVELTFLGTGTSAGVPMIACDCPVCRSNDPRDQRSRPSILLSYPDPRQPGLVRRLLVDTAPELRTQMIRHRVDRLDAVLFTHAHADHIFGLDDLRRFNAVMGRALDIYSEDSTLEILRSTFWYIFEPHRNVNQSFVAQLIPHALEIGRQLTLCGGVCTPLRLLHGHLPILGFRLDYAGAALAYCTDASCVPAPTREGLRDLDVLVVDALRYTDHPTHMTVDQALAVIDDLRPKRAYLTHIAHEVSHAELERRLPAGVYAAYDGLTVRVG